jgi:hypothetical protein
VSAEKYIDGEEASRHLERQAGKRASRQKR